jgi:hypothetical protein
MFLVVFQDSMFLAWEGRKVYLLVFDDDKSEDIEKVKGKIQGDCKVRDMGKAKHFLGMHIEKSRKDNCIKLSQKKFAEQLVCTAPALGRSGRKIGM